MKFLAIIFAASIVSASMCSMPPKGINIKGLKIDCAKAKKEAKKNTKNRKKADWPPTSI